MSTDNRRRWWVAGARGVEGPFAQKHVEAWLTSGQLARDVLLCPEGGEEWRAALACIEFATVAVVGGPPPLPRNYSNGGTAITNLQLPDMANWICVFCVAIVPILLTLNIFTASLGAMSASDTPAVQDEATEVLLGILVIIVLGLWGLRALAVSVLLLMGGLRLRNLRQSGVTLIKTGFWIDIITGPIVVLPLALLGALADAEGQTSTSALDVINNLLLFVELGAYVFEIVALFWLINNSRQLPLEAN